MIAQFSIWPMGKTHISGDVQLATKILSDHGLVYQVGPIGTCIEGDWQTIMNAIEKCHEAAAKEHERVMMSITIDDHGASQHSLRGAVHAVEHAGRTEPIETDTTKPVADA